MIMGEHNLEQEAEKLIQADNKEEFVSFLRSHLEMKNDAITTSKLLKLICLYRATGCATALLDQVETGLSVDLNVALEGGLMPLQLVAQTLSLSLTTTLLQHGAQVNVSDNNLAMLPLSMALKAICLDQNVSDWTPKKSIYKLIYIFCLKKPKEALETIKLLAEMTEDIDKVALHCVEEGEVIQFAALLLAAWDRLVLEPAEESLIGRRIWELIGIINNQESLLMLTCGFECDGLEFMKKKKMNLLMEWKLLRLLERGRGPIEEFRHADMDEYYKDFPNYEVPYILACKLHKYAGLNLSPDDIYSDDIGCLRPKSKEKEKVMLNEAISNHLQSMPMIRNFVVQNQGWRNEVLEKWQSESKMSGLNRKPVCCSQLPFKCSPQSRAYHTCRSSDCRQHVRSLDVHPSISMFLPAARVCARLCLAAKRSLK